MDAVEYYLNFINPALALYYLMIVLLIKQQAIIQQMMKKRRIRSKMMFLQEQTREGETHRPRKRREIWCISRQSSILHNMQNSWKSLSQQLRDREYRKQYRMREDLFYKLYSEVKDELSGDRSEARGRLPLDTLTQFSITMYWLATGSYFRSVAHHFGIGESTAHKYIHRTVRVLYNHLRNQVRFPQGEELHRVVGGFSQHLPLCAGSIDGCLIPIQMPKGLFGYRYYCYKKFYAILLLGVVDSDGRFLYVDAYNDGSMGDAAAFNKSPLVKAIENGDILQEAMGRTVEGTFVRPYLVGDAAFGLRPYLMKCYNGNPKGEDPEGVFNFHLIRCRRVVEAAFGRLKGRWRCLVSANHNNPDFMGMVTGLCCCLHNYVEANGEVMEELEAYMDKHAEAGMNDGRNIGENNVFARDEQSATIIRKALTLSVWKRRIAV